MKHEYFMQRCIELALSAEGKTSPNPLVGSVIVHQGKIIGEGFHQKAGEPHAEVNAIHSVKNPELLKSSTLYVSLEPCSHHGKTPPCSDLIIEKRIPEVVIGTKDIYSEVAGRGIRKLKAAGIKVTVGVLPEQCISLNKRFFTFHGLQRPYIILKWAETSDGFIADEKNNSKWISNRYSRLLVHKWRTMEEAIMVGTNTALHDDPELTAREWAGKNPLRVVIDKSLRLPENLKIFTDDQPVLVFNEKTRESKGNKKFEKVVFDNRFEERLLQKLGEKGIQSMIIEGGATLLNSFIRKGLWDEARVFRGTRFFGGGIKAPGTGVKPVAAFSVDTDILSIFENQINRNKIIQLTDVNKSL